MKVSLTVSRQKTSPSFMKTISYSLLVGSAYFSAHIVLPYSGETIELGIGTCLFIWQLNVFQKQIKLSILPVTKWFFVVASTQVTSRLWNDITFLHVRYSLPFCWIGCEKKTTWPSQLVQTNQLDDCSPNQQTLVTSYPMLRVSSDDLLNRIEPE